MGRFLQRVSGACRLDPRAYEDVEADLGATAQAVTVVAVVSVATGIGLLDAQAPSLGSLLTGTLSGFAAWVAWAVLTHVIGTQLLPEPATRADLGQLLRTLAFASAPGVIQAAGVVPALRLPAFAAGSIWMIAAMVVAVRQALDYSSTARAIGVCVVGWALVFALTAGLSIAFAPRVS